MSSISSVSEGVTSFQVNLRRIAKSILSTLRSVDGAAIARPELHLLSAKGEDALLRLTIHEGRNRQIRKMCALADLTVTRLRRVSEGPLQLGDLPVGAWRPLTAEEVARILG